MRAGEADGAQNGGDPEAQLGFAQQLFRVVQKACRSYGDLAGDIASETFLQIYADAREGRGFQGGNLTAYVTTVARRKYIDLVRKESRLVPLEPEREEAMDGSQQFDRRDLIKLLDEISAPQRICILLFYQNGFTYEEIARVTSYPLKQVRAHIQNGRIRLRKLLEDER